VVLLLGLLFYSNDPAVQGLTRRLVDMRTTSEVDAAAVANLNSAAAGP